MDFSSQLLGPSYAAYSGTMDCQETINLYLERGEKGYSLIKSPGISDSGVLTGLGLTSAKQWMRGLMMLNDVLYGVSGTSIYYSNIPAGTGAVLGPIADDNRPVSWASSQTQVCVCSGGIPYFIEAGVLATISWMSDTISMVAFIDNYFLFLNSAGTGFYYSEPGNANSGTAANFISASADANKFISMIVHGPNIWLFGAQVALPFYNAQNTAVPFMPNLSGRIMIGIYSPHSVMSIAGDLYWIGVSKHGGPIAYKNDGIRISNHAVENRWRLYAGLGSNVVSDPNFRAISYGVSFNGHTMWRIWFPTGDETWQYDPLTQDWTKQLWTQPQANDYHAHRGSCSAYWSAGSVSYVGDREFGMIYALSPNITGDNGSPIRWMRRTPALRSEGHIISHRSLEIGFEVGVGGVNDDVLAASTPLVTLKASDTYWKTPSNGRERSIGRQGEYIKRVRWDGLGDSRQRSYEISGTANVKTVMAWAALDAEEITT